MNRALFLIGVVMWTAATWVTDAQQTPATTPTPAANAQADGIPVESELVRARCGACHRVDDQMRMSRISFRRATPENWERTIKRMVSLNHAVLDVTEARDILKYLADHHGIAPSEARPAAFESEHRMVEFTYGADKETADTCSSCHTIGRVMGERRTKEEWELLVSMHRGYYPLVDNQPMNGGQGFRRTRAPQIEPGPNGQPPDNRPPMERVIAHLTRTFPLQTAEWTSWSASMQPVKLAGRWAVSGYQIGKGQIFGEVVIAADSAADNFSTQTHYTIARTGETVSRTGKAIVYTGFQWRGRGAAPGEAAPWREVLGVDPDWRTMSGRWFTGAYDETGIDVRLTRLGSDPTVFGSSITALKVGSSREAVKIYGANLPAAVTPADIGLGQGVRVTRVVAARPDEITVDIDVAANAAIGPRDLSVTGAVRPSTLVVFDKIDAVKIVPQAGLARVGGIVFPKQFQQFEAVGVSNGVDRKAGTADDINLGRVDVKWSLEEYSATFADDDVRYVGSVNADGLFTPNVDGPNPARDGNRNNVGDVWVVAELADQAGERSRVIRGRAHLLVTVPIYIGWYESEGGR